MISSHLPLSGSGGEPLSRKLSGETVRDTFLTSVRVLTGFRALLGLYLVAVPMLFGYRWDATSLNSVACGTLVLAPLLVSRRLPALRLVHVPVALWLFAAPFVFGSREGALYSDVFVGKMLLIASVGTPQMFEP